MYEDAAASYALYRESNIEVMYGPIPSGMLRFMSNAQSLRSLALVLGPWGGRRQSVPFR